jgi:arylsulfatase A-like enzyme
MAGKFFNKWNLDRNPPFFHRWASMTAGHRATFNVNGTLRSPDVYSTDYTATKAEDFLRFFDRKRDKRSWFLYVTPFAPHTPFQTAPEYGESSFPSWDGNPAVFEDRSDKPTYVETWDQSYERASWERQQQYRMLRSVDDLVADLLDTMNELDERNTLVVYTSDNGVFWGEHQLRQKHLPYTGAVKVPLMMRWPGRIAAGRVDSRLASLVDLAPTILDAANIAPYRGPMDGRSLLGPSQRKQLLIEYERDTLQNISGAIPRWRSIRDREKQYSVYLADDGTVLAEEYYDLVNDPWQLTNLLGDGDPTNDPGPLQRERLLRRIQTYSECIGTSGSWACP